MAEDEEDLNNFDREGLPYSGSEREIIEYYFHKGFEYKNIVLFLQRYHGIRLSERTLKRTLKDFGLKRRELVDENVFIYLALPTRAGSPQQHMPITVGPFCLTHPVNFPCGRKPEYPEETHDFRQSVDFYSFHMRTGFESH